MLLKIIATLVGKPEIAAEIASFSLRLICSAELRIHLRRLVVKARARAARLRLGPQAGFPRAPKLILRAGPTTALLRAEPPARSTGSHGHSG